MTEQIIRVREEWRGTRGGQYYYIREGNILKRISEYASKQIKVSESRRGPTIEFEIPVEKIKEKLIYSLGFSNSGYFFASSGKIDAFLYRKYPEYPWIPDHDRMKSVEKK